MLPDQPTSIGDLLTNRYANDDYSAHRKQWREVYNMNAPNCSCKPYNITILDTSINPRKKKY